VSGGGAEPEYILVTSIFDCVKAPAAELAALYYECRETETAYDEMKTHFKEAGGALRSKTLGMAKQRVYVFFAGALYYKEHAASCGGEAFARWWHLSFHALLPPRLRSDLFNK
jgi:hypothetical protein